MFSLVHTTDTPLHTVKGGVCVGGRGRMGEGEDERGGMYNTLVHRDRKEEAAAAAAKAFCMDGKRLLKSRRHRQTSNALRGV